MREGWNGTVVAWVEQLVALAAEDDRLREAVHGLASALADATAPAPARSPRAPGPGGPTAEAAVPPAEGAEAPAPAEVEAVADGSAPTLVLADDQGPPARPSPPIEPLRELTFHRGRPPASEPSPAVAVDPGAADPHAELPAIEGRCRLKARGIRWAVDRVRLRDAGDDIGERDRAILDEGRRLGAFLWMNTPTFEVPRDADAVEEVADSFEALAEALALARRIAPEAEADRDLLRSALELVAEAQSALRVAVRRVGIEEDQDQSAAFRWLRGMTDRAMIFVERHMRLADPAEPAQVARLRDRIGALVAEAQAARGRTKKKQNLLKKLRWHAGRLDRRDPLDENWPKVVAAIDALVIEEGIPPSSVDLREVLLPLHDDLPDRDDLPPGFRLALREVDDYLAGRDAPAPAADPTPEAPSPAVAEVADWLRGRKVMLIGGSRRPGPAAALEAAFGLDELIWVSTREHESIDKFGPIVARPEVALVLLAIRWSSHSFGEVKQFCDSSDKPLVRLPGGYGVNQVAAQVVAQVSQRLARAPRDACP